MIDKEVRYYKVLAKCGHVGRHRYYLGAFYVKALNGKDAANIVKNKPRTKKHHKDVIQDVQEILYRDYLEGKRLKALEPYWKCKTSSEQKKIWSQIKDKIFPETEQQLIYRNGYKRKNINTQQVYVMYKKGKLIRNPYKYIKMNLITESA